MSTMMCRLRPTTFFPPIEAPDTAGLSGSNTLAIDNRSRGRWGTPGTLPICLPELSSQALPDPELFPGLEVIEHPPEGWEVVGQEPPLAAGTFDVEDGIDDLSGIDGPGATTHPRGLEDERLDDLPLGIGEIGGIPVLGR